MFSFIKSLFGDSRASAPVSKSSTASAAETVARSTPAPTRACHLTPRIAPLPPVSPAGPAPGPSLEISLLAIADRLAPALRSRLSRAPSAQEMVKLPLATVLDQLPRGAIRIPFGLLRQATRRENFVGGTDSDETLVEVPVAEVLARLDPALLARRPAQRSVTPPEGLPNVFSSQPGPAAKSSSSAPVLPTPRIPVSAAHDQLQASRLLAQTRKGPSAAQPFNPQPPPGRLSMSQPRSPITPLSKAPSGGSTEPESEPIKVPLVSLAKNWPDPMRREILATHLSTSVNLPFVELEAAMKRGKVVFSWKQIRLWMSPKPAVALPEHDSVGLELPLAVLAPLFLARRSPAHPKKTVSSGDEIPDIFRPRRAENVPAPAEPVVLPPLEPARPGAPDQPMPGPDPALGSSCASRPTSPSATSGQGAGLDKLTAVRSSPVPTQLVQRACQLSGVAGVVVGTADGLVIASQLPSGVNAETVAAFLPQIYSRLGQYTRELKLGDPTQVEMLLGKVPFQIYRCASAYFAVLGKASEPMPKLQLTALAAQLSAQTN